LAVCDDGHRLVPRLIELQAFPSLFAFQFLLLGCMRKAYPAILAKTGLNDSQVMYWEPAKYVAKMRTLKTDAKPLLLKINMGAGHGGASGRYDYLREIALDYAFLLMQLDIRE